MTAYRLYLRDALGIVCRDDFEASDDCAAAAIAELVWDACSDECDRYELWQQMRRVSGGQKPLPAPRILPGQITVKAQESAIAREEAIRSSTWAVARSRRLLERLDALHLPPG